MADNIIWNPPASPPANGSTVDNSALLNFGVTVNNPAPQSGVFNANGLNTGSATGSLAKLLVPKAPSAKQVNSEFSVDKIIAQVQDNNFSKPNLYKVQILGANASVMMNCSSVNVPGININYVPNMRHGIGLTNKFAQGKDFMEVNMTFYESAKESERVFFLNWMEQIYNSNTGRFGFYKDYVRDILITLYNRQGVKQYVVQCRECFPTAVSPLERSYSSDHIGTFTVAFQIYDTSETNQLTPATPAAQIQTPAFPFLPGQSSVPMSPNMSYPVGSGQSLPTGATPGFSWPSASQSTSIPNGAAAPLPGVDVGVPLVAPKSPTFIV